VQRGKAPLHFFSFPLSERGTEGDWLRDGTRSSKATIGRTVNYRVMAHRDRGVGDTGSRRSWRDARLDESLIGKR